MYIADYPGYDWHVVISGAPWEVVSNLEQMAAHFAEGDHGLIRLELRAPLPQDVVTWLEGALRSATDQISGAVKQIGNVLHIPFVVGAIPFAAIAGVLLGAAAFILAMATMVSVLRGDPVGSVFDLGWLTPELLLVGLGTYVVLSR